MKTPVLMYHEITDRSIKDIPVEERPYAITSTAFDQQLEYLVQHGFVSQFVESGQPVNNRSIVITFDDGFASDAAAALPRLMKYGIKAEFYITTGWIGKPGYVSKFDIRAIADAGMVLGTHGVNHKYFDDLNETELKFELLESKMVLEDIIGQEIAGGSAPGGRIHPKTRQIASDLGYRYLCVSDANLADLAPTDQFRFIPRFSVKREMPMGQYAKLASGNKIMVLLNNAKTRTLTIAKYALGNRNYERVRHKLLSSKKVD